MYKICILNIFIPHVVEPAQPPINIRPKNKIIGKLPQSSYLAFTYPVPVKIEITLKTIGLKLNFSERSWKIMIGHWLKRFIYLCFDRYHHLKSILKEYKDSVDFNVTDSSHNSVTDSSDNDISREFVNIDLTDVK